MRGDYVKTTWANGVAPGINATRLNNSENKINEIDKSVISKTARFTIGTSTSGWTAGDVDYLCDGVNDQIKINNAITALPATGGEIIILDGTYNITAKISVNKANVTLSGNGNATKLTRMYNSAVPEGVVTVETGMSGCKVRYLNIDGTKATYPNTNNYGILSLTSYTTIVDNVCNNNAGASICLLNAINNTLIGNTCNSNTSTGIDLNGSSNNTILGNTCNSNVNGIYLANGTNNTISANICNNNTSRGIGLAGSSNNTISANACNNNTVYGIYSDTSNNNVVTGNMTYNNTAYGIFLSASSRNNVIGNECIRGTGIVGDYTAGQYTIALNAAGNNYNSVSSNMCMGKDVVNGGGVSNTLVNNKFT